MQVRIPSPLRSYTDGAAVAEADGATLRQLIADLDCRHPGFGFRVVDEQGRLRPHLRVFVNREVADDLDRPVAPSDEVVVMQALSGG